MNLTRSAGCFALAGFVALTGCSGAEDGVTDDVINTTPASLAEANAEMDKIDRIMAESGATPELVERYPFGIARCRHVRRVRVDRVHASES